MHILTSNALEKIEMKRKTLYTNHYAGIKRLDYILNTINPFQFTAHCPRALQHKVPTGAMID